MSRSTLLQGTMILTVATLLSKILGSIFRIPLQNIAGDEVLGIFSLVYPVYMVALILSVAGIPTAISKIIAEERAVHPKSKTIRTVYLTASVLALGFGIISFSLIYLFSSPIAEILGGQSTKFALIFVSATLLVAPYMAVYRGFFQGYGDMRPTALSQVIEQFIRVGCILIIAFVLVSWDFSSEDIAGYIMIGSVAGALVSLIYLRITYHRFKLKPKRTTFSFAAFINMSKRILKVSIPIAIGSITMALVNVIDSVTIPFSLRSFGITIASDIHYYYGIYGRGLALVQIATVFATSIVLPLIPLLTKKLVNQDKVGMKETVERAFFMANVISWPAAFGLLALTLPINLGLFSDLEGSTMLAIIGFSSVFTSLTVLGTGILQGINLANKAAIIILIGILIKTFSNIFLIQWLGLDGAALSTLFIYILLCIVNVIFIYRAIPFSWQWGSVFKIFLASLVMGSVIGIPTLFVSIADWSRWLAIGYVGGAIVLGGLIYIGLLLGFKVISVKDVKQALLFRK